MKTILINGKPHRALKYREVRKKGDVYKTGILVDWEFWTHQDSPNPEDQAYRPISNPRKKAARKVEGKPHFVVCVYPKRGKPWYLDFTLRRQKRDCLAAFGKTPLGPFRKIEKVLITPIRKAKK